MADDKARGARAFAAFDDRFVKKPLMHPSGHQGANRNSACGRSGDRYVILISSKRRNILLNPTQRRDHIQKAVIARRGVVCLAVQRRQGQPSECAQPIIWHDDNHVIVTGKLHSVPRTCRSIGESTAMKIDQHGHLFSFSASRGPVDVQIEAVFVRRRELGQGAALHAGWGELRGVQCCGVWLRGNGGAPPEIADRRRCKRDAAELLYIAGRDSLNRALPRVYDGSGSSRLRFDGENQKTESGSERGK